MADMPTELIVGAIGILTAAGGGLSVATGKLWSWVDKRIQDCEKDRTVLHEHIDGMNTELKTLSRTVGHMEGTLQEITSRNSRIDHEKK
jgi:hypothetical protein